MLTPFAVQFRYAPYDDSGCELDRGGVILESRKLMDYVTALLDEAGAGD